MKLEYAIRTVVKQVQKDKALHDLSLMWIFPYVLAFSINRIWKLE